MVTFRTYRGAPVELKPGVTPDDVINPTEMRDTLREELRKVLPQPQSLRVLPVYKYQGPHAIGQLDYNPDTDRLLISGYDSNKLFEIDMDNKKTWEMTLDIPNTAYYLGDGTILVLEMHQVPVTPTTVPKIKRIRMSDKSVLSTLNLPTGSGAQSAYPLPNPLEWNGHTLITYRSFPGRNPRVVEIDKTGSEVWAYEPTTPTLSTPSFAIRARGHMAVIPDFRHRVIEVNPDGTIGYQYGVTDRLGVGDNRLNTPENVVLDPKRSEPKVLIADYGNDRIVVWYPYRNKWFYLPFIVQHVSGMAYNRLRDTLFACSNDELTIYELPIIEADKPPFLESVADKLWDNETLGVGGDTTIPAICKGYKRKNIYFLTDTNGDITIEIDPDGGGNWMTLHSETAIGVRGTTNPWVFSTEYEFWQLRVSFSAAATVSCWIVRG